MFFIPVNLKTNYTKEEYAIADTPNPIFSWGVKYDEKGGYQSEYRIKVTFNNTVLWDSGFVADSNHTATYSGSPLPSGAIINWELQIKDQNGRISNIAKSYFKTACFDTLCGSWISSPLEKEYEVQYFTKQFEIDKKPCRAVLYYCGIGLSKAYINGKPADNYMLQPAHTNYAKECFYVTAPLDDTVLSEGENTIDINVACGWRKNLGPYLDNMSSDRKIEFIGNMCLWAQLVLYYENGDKTVISTDESWKCTNGAITSAHLFNGETYDENFCPSEPENAVLSDFSPLSLSPQYIEPIVVKRELFPQNSYLVNGKYIYDFSENLTGIVKLKATGNCKGVKFIMRHAEEVAFDGDLFCDTLRSAKATDTYICRDGECDFTYIPQFTYHGFRYLSLEIQGEFDGDIEISALSLYTDIDTDGFFKCGNQTVNEFYRVAVRTEQCNLHSIASDCPQRDERMAWMNDATVRFMSMPYQFSAIRLFEKICSDIANEQDEQGRITCTAPFVYGERPADPVCSSYLIAALENYKMSGDTSLIKKHYDGFKAWNNYLKSCAPDGIVNYSYYGDWAGPEDCCYSTATIGNSDVEKTEEYDTGAANSLYIPGEMMSTVIYYMNLQIMLEFSRLTGTVDEEEYSAEANRIQTAFLDNWFNSETATVHNGSQGAQAVALYVGIIPEQYRKKAADVMAEAVISDGYRLKTGNLATPMLFQMLSEYGYSDIAWKLITSSDYPSFGYMFANGATTMWERFELKKECGMNSHCHPMYGASTKYLYHSLAGFKAVIPNKEYKINPSIPKDLLYFEMRIPLLCDSVYIKYENRYNTENFCIDVPFGMKITLDYNNKKYILESGFHSIDTQEI